jgi:penicillin-binding protein 1A
MNKVSQTLNVAGQKLKTGLSNVGSRLRQIKLPNLTSTRSKISTLQVGKHKQSRKDIADKNSPKALSATKTKQARRRSLRRKLRKVALVILCVMLLAGVVGSVVIFAKVQQLDAKLPPVDNPFQDRELASVIYDRNGVELYKMYDKFNRDPLTLEDIPYHVRWAFLAAEDVDFYTHQGFDALAIASCAVRNAVTRRVQCGGSTITQQMVKITLGQSDSTIDRKISELLMAVKIEQRYSKDEILQLYLSVVPFGSNIYGLTAASRFYFGVEPKNLTLSQAAILASIGQSPARLSPTVPFDGDKEKSQELVKERQLYVLGQLEEKMQRINEQHRKNIGKADAEDLFTKEFIDKSRSADLVYRAPVFTNKKAGHFVDFVMEQLQKRNYKNNEEPFELSELQTEGLRIYTTLDYGLQTVAEGAVANGVNAARRYNIHNGGIVTIKPSTGEVITMVGSRSYYGKSEGCEDPVKERNCLYNPQVNVINSRQSPGSSSKPHGYQEAYRQGKLFPGSLLPDIPLSVPGYRIQNALGNFIGVGKDPHNPSTTAAEMLNTSRNLPAVMVVNLIGVARFVEMMQQFGYTTFTNPSQYGPSVILGGSDVLPIEHAQGYGVFANGGDLVRYEVITKIEDRYGKVIWELKNPERKRVGDPQAIYQLNSTMKNNVVTSWDGRDIATKTGTSEDYKDLWLASYTPDMVTIAWMGNNNNVSARRYTFAINLITPWVRNYMRHIGGSPHFNKKTPFSRPGGIVSGGGFDRNAEGEYNGISRSFMVDGRKPPADVVRAKRTVCKDQPTRLARQVDIDMGMAEERWFNRYVMQTPEFQAQFDEDFKRRYGFENKIPDQQCDLQRVNLTATVTGGANLSVSGSIAANTGNNYTINLVADNPTSGVVIGTITPNADGTFNETLSYPATSVLPNGKYTIYLTTSPASTTRSFADIIVRNDTSNAISVSASDYTFAYGKTVTVSAGFSGFSSPTKVEMYVSKNGGAFTLARSFSNEELGTGTVSMSDYFSAKIANETATYRVYAVVYHRQTGVSRSNDVITINVNGATSSSSSSSASTTSTSSSSTSSAPSLPLP